MEPGDVAEAGSGIRSGAQAPHEQRARTPTPPHRLHARSLSSCREPHPNHTHTHTRTGRILAPGNPRGPRCCSRMRQLARLRGGGGLGVAHPHMGQGPRHPLTRPSRLRASIHTLHTRAYTQTQAPQSMRMLTILTRLCACKWARGARCTSNVSGTATDALSPVSACECVVRACMCVPAQGSVNDLMTLTGWQDSKVLYFGDNLLSDSMEPRKLCTCRGGKETGGALVGCFEPYLTKGPTPPCVARRAVPPPPLLVGSTEVCAPPPPLLPSSSACTWLCTRASCARVAPPPRPATPLRWCFLGIPIQLAG
jgi:hypothetical protein